MRNRSVLRQEQNGGQACPKTQQTHECNTKMCPGNYLTVRHMYFNMYISNSVDCKMSEWTSWSSCSKTCRGGTRMRNRSVLRQEQNGGQACPKVQQTYECNTHECPGNQLTNVF